MFNNIITMCIPKILLVIVVILIVMTLCTKEYFISKLQPNITQRFISNGYEYANNRSNRHVGGGKSFPVIWYTMKGCHYCNQFENSGVWDKLKAEYVDKIDFEVVQREDAPDYIHSFPTIIAELDGGATKLTYDGNREHEHMRQWLNQILLNR